MSAGSGTSKAKVNHDLSLLAPKFAQSVLRALNACQDAGYDAIVFEGQRSQDLQALYYARGRTIIPPTHPVTYAPTNLLSWHGYGLAVDIVDRTKYWNPDGGETWFKTVAQIFKRNDCSWGGDWKKPDTPHFQWFLCKPSPSRAAQRLMLTEGRMAVWAALGAA